MTEPVILLDLNSTYAANASEVHLMQVGIYHVQREVYRKWLTELLRGRTVVMMTARPAQYAAETLARIKALEGWAPELALFNQWRAKAADAKARMLRETVIPRFGAPEGDRYVAIESNSLTRAMFAKQGIKAYTQQQVKANPDLLGPSRVQLSLI